MKGLAQLALMAAQILGGVLIAISVVPASQKQPKKTVSTPPESYQDKSKSVAPEEKIKPLIVMIKCRLGDEESFGAGIIFGFGNDRIYIATANHVVRKGAQEAQNLRVQFIWLPGESIEAQLLDHSDNNLDLAVLAVIGRHGMDSTSMSFNQLGDTNSLKRRDVVYTIGNPHGQQWRVSVTPDKVSSKSGNVISFESAIIGPGHSGGALLNESWELVGMIKESEPPDGVAVSIQGVVDTLREWRYPVNLGPASPRSATPVSDLSELRQEAEKIASDWMAAWLRGDAATVVKLSSTPFYFDQEILLQTADISRQFEKLFLEKGQLWKSLRIMSIKTQTITELQQGGYDTRRDRVLKNLYLRDEDFSVMVTTAKDIGGSSEGLLIFLRKTDSGLRVAGMWD